MLIYHRNIDRKRRYEKDNGDDERTDVIVKIGNKWKIKGKKVKYWNASYDTKADAQAALRAYWANKHEARKASFSLHHEQNEHPRRSFNEGFLSDFGKKWMRDIQHYLITIFGHTLYFDRTSDKETGLFYRGQCVAEFLYNEPREEVIIYPTDETIAPRKFYDTNDFEVKDFLSDLILGDIQPDYAF